MITRQTFIDLMTVDLVSQRRGHWELLDENKIRRMFHVIPRKYDVDVIRLEYPDLATPRFADANKMLIKKSILMQILKLGDGCLSLCGGKISDYLQNNYSYSDYDLFFHSCSEEQATVILHRCLEYLSREGGFKYFRSQGCITVKNYEYCFQFILRLYESPDQILGGFDLWASKIGFDLKRGIFATIHGAFALITRCQPIDTSKRSMSYEYRLEKYQRGKHIGIVFPGYSRDAQLSECSQANISHGTFYPRHHQTSDYQNPRTHMNWFHIKNDRMHMVTIKVKNYQDVLSVLTEEIIKDGVLFDEYGIFAKPSRRNVFDIKPNIVDNVLFFLGPETIKRFKQLYYIEYNMEQADQIWKQACDAYVSKAVEHFATAPLWRTVDPGSQAFGSDNPIIANPRDWYGPNYVPVRAGLSNEIFCTIWQCWRKSPVWKDIPRDIFRLLCSTVLQLQAQDIFNSYVNHNQKIFISKSRRK